jgi:hypothetical protein
MNFPRFNYATREPAVIDPTSVGEFFDESEVGNVFGVVSL